MFTLLFIIAAYLLGSISFAVIVSRVLRLSDPRTYGSKNPGATNVLRSGNKIAAFLTLLGDAAKGWCALWLSRRYGAQFGISEVGMALVALAVFFGHLWPVFFRFIGGKGVATALGVLLGINIWLGLATLATWIIVAYAFRYSSLAALIAGLFAPFYYCLLFGAHLMLGAIGIMSCMLIYRHADNIGKLIQGKETRIGTGK